MRDVHATAGHISLLLVTTGALELVLEARGSPEGGAAIGGGVGGHNIELATAARTAFLPALAASIARSLDTSHRTQGLQRPPPLGALHAGDRADPAMHLV